MKLKNRALIFALALIGSYSYLSSALAAPKIVRFRIGERTPEGDLTSIKSGNNKPHLKWETTANRKKIEYEVTSHGKSFTIEGPWSDPTNPMNTPPRPMKYTFKKGEIVEIKKFGNGPLGLISVKVLDGTTLTEHKFSIGVFRGRDVGLEKIIEPEVVSGQTMHRAPREPAR